jgi:nucleoid-associated protein YgaU
MELALAVSSITAVVSLAAALPAVGRGIVRVGLPRLTGRLFGVTAVAASLCRIGSAAAEVPPPSVRLIAAGVEPAAASPAAAAEYTVVSGDCLWRIAAAMLAATGDDPTSAEIAALWPRIYAANRGLIGDDPNLILVGQVLMLPEVSDV